MNIVTRFDIFDRKGDETEGTEDHQTVRLFEKRKLVGEVDLEDVARFANEETCDNWEAEFAIFLFGQKLGDKDAKPRSVEDCLDWLGEEPEDEEEEERDGGSIVPDKYRVLYGAAQNNGDEIALALTGYVTVIRRKRTDDGGLNWDRLREVAAANGLEDKLVNYEYNGLKGGQCRMNIGNILRGMNRRGEKVVIGQDIFPAREVAKEGAK